MARIADDQSAIAKILARSSAAPPDALDLPGLAWLLEAAYSEIEELLKGVATHLGESLPSASTWHRDLLEQLALPTDRRKAVLSPELKTALDDYRAFRHFSRNATFLVLDWHRMAPLLSGLESLVNRFRRETVAFLKSLEP